MLKRTHGSRHPRVNMLRRGVGIAVCLAPVLLLLASLVFWTMYSDGGFAGLGLAVAGLLFGILNSYLSFVRPWLYHWRRGSMDGHRFVSGLPLFGTLFVVFGGVVGFGELPTALIGLATLVLDTGGLPWFLIATWHDRSLWDAEPGAAPDRGRKHDSA